MNAETLIATKDRGTITADRIEIGDEIKGEDGGTAKWCRVVSNADSGDGTVFGSFTAGHMVVSPTGAIVAHGNTTPGRQAALRNIATDCPFATTADGQGFTPFSTVVLPPDTSIKKYLAFYAAIMELTKNKALAFLWNPRSWHDNETNHLWAALKEFGPAVIKCSAEEDCADFENTTERLLQSNLGGTKLNTTRKVWPNTTFMAAHISGIGKNQNFVMHIAIAVASTLALSAALLTAHRRSSTKRAAKEGQTETIDKEATIVAIAAKVTKNV